MSRICVSEINGVITADRVRGQHSVHCVGHLPSGASDQDLSFVTKAPDGTFYICQKKKSAWMKEQISNG